MSIPAGQAIAVARRFHGPLARAAKKPVFVECNAISPATMRQIAGALESSGCKLVDAGIIGGPPRTDRPDEGPRFYASGQDAHLMSDLGKFGLDADRRRADRSRISIEDVLCRADQRTDRDRSCDGGRGAARRAV